LTLPYRAISQWLLRRAEASAGVRVEAVSVRRLYPLGLQWEGVTISGPVDGAPKVSLASLSIEPVLASLWSPRRVALVRARVADGVVEGQIGLTRPSAPNQPAQYHVNVSRIDGVDLAALQPWVPSVTGLGGRLVGSNVSYAWASDKPLFGVGTLFLDAKPAQMTVSRSVWMSLASDTPAGGAIAPLLPEQIRFDEATCGASLQQGQLELTNCRATGPQGQVTVSGSIRFEEPIARSLLALHLQLAWQGLTPAGGPPVSLGISGPLGHRQYQLEGGMPLPPTPAPPPGGAAPGLL